MSTTLASNSPRTPSRLPEYDSQVPRSHSPTKSHPLPSPTSGLPTKRPRTANMATERASSSSDSSDHSGMADNETEAERSQQSERSAPQATAPPKKKRTRTLTTPHQSAVLHALLAKSRFPTTAMREEVGRQIGLSARKVQIWFQNQRQKARRPQAESAPLTRPPQFGPFPIMTPAGPSPSSPYASPSGGGAITEMPHSTASSSHSPRRTPRGSHDSNPALLGPGIPGWSPTRHPGPSSAEEWDPPLRVPKSSPGSSRHPFLPPRSEPIPAHDSRGHTRALALQPAQATHVETSPRFSRTLPPINLSPLEPRSSTEQATSPFPPQSLPLSRTLANVVQRHDSSAHIPAVDSGSSPRSLSIIPPPFALQPKPQWDPQTFSPYTRPEFASWSGSVRSTSFSLGGAYDRGQRNDSPGDGGSGRFHSSLGDPVPPPRATPFDPLSPRHTAISPRGPSRRLSTSRHADAARRDS